MIAPAFIPSSDGSLSYFSSRSDTAYSQNSSRQYLSSSHVTQAAGTSVNNIDGVKLFEQLLVQRSERFIQQVDISAPATGSQANAIRPYEYASSQATKGTAASVILGFIENRLQKDQQEGASISDLASRIQAGLEGFQKGFNEAKEQLQAMGLMAGDVSETVDQIYDEVMGGIEQLKEKYLGVPATAEPAPDPVSEDAMVLQGFQQYSYQQQNTFSFTLTTKDGDVVEVRANAAESFSASAVTQYGYSETAQSMSQSLSGTYSNAQQFSLEISGELDDDELTAINDLLGQVNDLASEFFAGDVQQAFESAKGIGYNSEEIAGFALNLTRTEITRVTSAYQQFNPGESTAGIPLAQSLMPLGQFTQNLLDALETASYFDQPQQLISDLANNLFRDNQDVQDQTENTDSPSEFGRFITEYVNSLAAPSFSV